MRTVRCRALATVILLGIGGLAGASGDEARNLVVITIDTWRADYLGLNGAADSVTPHLDRLARGGVNFTQARAPVPLTLPSHASIFTGSYPPVHGVRDNGTFRLEDGRTTLAEVLSERGYLTAAFVGSFVLDKRFGLAQGFDTYDDRVWSEIDELESLTAERSAAKVFSSFSAWMAARQSERPFFAWIHLYDPHAPYEPPEPFRSAHPADPYAGEVAYVDHVVGQVVELLSAESILARTLLAVVGDHGEGLGEHGEGTHSVLIYNSTLHVPMLLHAPGVVPEGRVVDDLVRLIDLAPTLLDLLEIDVRLGEGVSLRLTLRESAARLGELSSYSESLYPQLQLGWSALRGLEKAGHKLIVAPSPELYDLTKDPHERINLAVDEAATFQRLKREMAELLVEFDESIGPGAVPTDPEIEARLRSLGYVGGRGRSAGRGGGPPVDPKERMAEWGRIQEGIHRFSVGDFRGVVQSFESVLREDPQIVLAYEYLASAWMELSQTERAEEVCRSALARGLDSAELHRQLSRIHLARGESALALDELEITLAMDPRHVQSHFDIGQIHRQAGRPDRAIEHYRRAVALNPDYVWGWNALGLALASMARAEEALQAFETVVRIDPLGAAGHFNLAVHLEHSGQKAMAVESYRRFLELASAPELEAQRRRAREAISRLSM